MSSEGRRSPGRAAHWFVTAVIALGLAVVGAAAADLARAPVSGLWVVLMVLTAVTGLATLRVPGMPISFSISDTFSMIAALVVGPAAGALTAALDGLVLSFRMSNDRRSATRILFNMAFPAVATWVSAQVFFAMAGAEPLAAGPAGAFRLLAMLTVFGLLDFGLTTGAVAMAVALERGDRVIGIWREHFVGLWMTYFGGVFAAMLMMVVGQLGALEVLILIGPLPIILYVAFRHAEARAHDQIQHLGKMNSVYLAAIEALAQAIDTKDQVTHEHIRRVQTESVRLAGAVGVSDTRVIEAIKAAALLHDVGKIGIPEHILNKPGRLNASEFEIMKTHAAMGAEILSVIDFPYPVVPIVRHHHENWDGTGYPDGLAGEEIPIGARILQIVDCFDALTSDRPYRRAMPVAGALQILADRRGNMYDPGLVDAFFALQGADQTSEMAPEGAGSPEPVRIDTRPAPEPAPADAAAPGALGAFCALGGALDRAAGDTGRLGAAVWAHVGPLVPASAFVLYAYDAASHALVAAFRSDDTLLAADTRIPVGERLSGWVAATGQPVVNSDGALDLLDGKAGQGRMKSTLAVAATQAAHTVAVLTFYASTPEAFTDAHARIAAAAAAALAAASAAPQPHVRAA